MCTLSIYIQRTKEKEMFEQSTFLCACWIRFTVLKYEMGCNTKLSTAYKAQSILAAKTTLMPKLYMGWTIKPKHLL